MTTAAGELDQLVQAERDLDAELAAARLEAQQLLEKARDAAREREARLDHEIRGELDRLESGVRQDAQDRVADTIAEAERQAQGYRIADQERIRSLAGRLVQRLVTGAQS